ncbi:MAG: hypothetical protein KJ646_02875 [Nanoarchaeota archaeon]|nr:hypothetical protein [Nanoarchaeota archaeon]MBU4116253.1 hypothetical protein [Nanoarchaeota archaeon]
MEKEKFTFRQKWFPTMDDADKLERARGGDYSAIGVGQFFSRWARSIFLAGTLIWGGYQGIGNNIEYSEGQRVGVVNKISEKGLIWKTKEGQLSLEGRTSTGDYTGAGVWDFSIDKSARHGENVDGLYSQISKEMENGQRVKITYKEPLATWPWRADTTYLVQSVEPLETKTIK